LKPIVILNINGYFDPLIEMLHRAIDESFMRCEHADIWRVATSAHEAVELLYTTPLWNKNVRKLAAI
jgi:predicted Rossmann-fold nucleotide-binding protein